MPHLSHYLSFFIYFNISPLSFVLSPFTILLINSSKLPLYFTFIRHVIICFGGLSGLEPVIDSDETLKETAPRDLFDYYLNTCPNQGSRTIRTEVRSSGVQECFKLYEILDSRYINLMSYLP